MRWAGKYADCKVIYLPVNPKAGQGERRADFLIKSVNS